MEKLWKFKWGVGKPIVKANDRGSKAVGLYLNCKTWEAAIALELASDTIPGSDSQCCRTRPTAALGDNW